MPVVTLPILKSNLPFSCDWHVLAMLFAFASKAEVLMPSETHQSRGTVCMEAAWGRGARVHHFMGARGSAQHAVSKAEACLLSASLSL